VKRKEITTIFCLDLSVLMQAELLQEVVLSIDVNQQTNKTCKQGNSENLF
jgi:hypothetical protein